MKKIIALLLVLVMLLGFAACSNKAKYAYGNVYALSNVLEGSVKELYVNRKSVSEYPIPVSELAQYEADGDNIVTRDQTGMFFEYVFESETDLGEIIMDYYKALRVNEDWVPEEVSADCLMGAVIKGDDVYYLYCVCDKNSIIVSLADEHI